MDIDNLPPDLSALVQAWPTLGSEVRGLLRALFAALGRSEGCSASREEKEG
jgi:hypothetical protein